MSSLDETRLTGFGQDHHVRADPGVEVCGGTVPWAHYLARDPIAIQYNGLGSAAESSGQILRAGGPSRQCARRRFDRDSGEKFKRYRNCRILQWRFSTSSF